MATVRSRRRDVGVLGHHTRFLSLGILTKVVNCYVPLLVHVQLQYKRVIFSRVLSLQTLPRPSPMPPTAPTRQTEEHGASHSSIVYSQESISDSLVLRGWRDDWSPAGQNPDILSLKRRTGGFT